MVILNITDNTNLLEIYFCSKQLNSDVIDISLDKDILDKVRNKFKKTREYEYANYYRNNNCYVYDLSNDSQYVYNRILEKTEYYEQKRSINIDVYMINYIENKLPTHYFSCTNDLDYKEIIKIEEFKINNRINIIIKNNISCFIQYKHNKAVELDKTKDIIDNIIKKMIN